MPKQVRNRLIATYASFAVVVLFLVVFEAIRHPEKGFSAALTAGLIASLSHLGGMATHLAKSYLRDELTEDPRLTDMLANDSLRLGRKPIKVKIARGPSGAKRLQIDSTGKSIIVPSAVQDRLSREELRFMLATTLGQAPWLWLLAFPVVAAAPFLALPLATPLGPRVLAMTFVAIVCVLCVALPALAEFYRRARIYNQMDAALRATLDPKSGASALAKLVHDKPTRADRRTLRIKLACLRRATKAQGLPDLPDPTRLAPQSQPPSTPLELRG